MHKLVKRYLHKSTEKEDNYSDLQDMNQTLKDLNYSKYRIY